MKREKRNGVKRQGPWTTCLKGIGKGLTEQDLQGVRMQLQVLRLLLYHIHVLGVLAVEAVDTGIGQHLGEPRQYIQPELRHLHLPSPLLGSSIQAPLSALSDSSFSPSCLPDCYNLSSLLEGPAGILQEGEGFGRWHLLDGRGLVPQVDSKLLLRGKCCDSP